MAKQKTKKQFNPIALVKNLLNPLSKREKKILRRRYYLEGQKEKETLELIGRSYRLTRERVRQIINQAVKNIKKSPRFEERIKPVRRVLTGLLREYGSAMSRDHFQRVLLKCFLPGVGPDSQRGRVWQAHINFIALALLTESLEEAGHLKRFKPTWKLKGISLKFFNQAMDDFLAILKTKKQPLKLEVLLDLFKKRPFWRKRKVKVTEKIIKPLLIWSNEINKNVFGHWGPVGWPTICPRGVGDKAYLVLKKIGKPLHFVEITRLINKQGFGKRQARVPTVHNELIKSNNFVLVGRGLYGLKEWGCRPGTVSDIVKMILGKKGPLTRQEIDKKVLAQRAVRRETIHLALSNTRKFKRLSNGKYRLK